jgi:hypothetical protein
MFVNERVQMPNPQMWLATPAPILLHFHCVLSDERLNYLYLLTIVSRPPYHQSYPSFFDFSTPTKTKFGLREGKRNSKSYKLSYSEKGVGKTKHEIEDEPGLKRGDRHHA